MKQSLIRSLRWSEKFVKTDMVYLVKNSGWVFLGQMATGLSAFVVMAVLANLVSKEILGEYRFMISVFSILVIFTLPGLNTALVQSTARGYEGQLNLATRTKMRWGLIATLIAWTVSGYYLHQSNASLAASFGIVGLLMPLSGAYFVYFFYLQGKQRFAEATITQSLGRILFLIIMIATALTIPTATALITEFLVSGGLIKNILKKITWTKTLYLTATVFHFWERSVP